MTTEDKLEKQNDLSYNPLEGQRIANKYARLQFRYEDLEQWSFWVYNTADGYI